MLEQRGVPDPPASEVEQGWLTTARDVALCTTGYVRFRTMSRWSKRHALAFRRLHAANPSLVRQTSRVLSLPYRVRGRSSEGGVLDLSAPEVITRAVERLDADGYYIFPATIPDEVLQSLRAASDRIPCYSRLELGRGARPTPDREYRPDQALATRYDYLEDDLVHDPAILDLTTDPTLGAVADAYLRMRSIQVRTDMWRSIPHDDGPQSVAAQMFHADRDHARTLKFFVYLSDVDASHGPHVYVRGSHRGDHGFRQDRRYTDEEVAEAFGSDGARELCGPAGTVIAADTAGLHKGKHPVDGQRLVVGVQYASGCYGVRVDDFEVRDVLGDATTRIRRDPRRFQRFRTVEA